MCGDSHWKAAQNTARRKGKLDETGLEIAGCRHGLAQWAVNMYRGEMIKMNRQTYADPAVWPLLFKACL